MPLRVSSNNKGTWITWESPDESQSATFRIKPEMDEAEMLAMLVKAVTFIAKQMGEIDQQIAELEAQILGLPSATAPAPPAGQATAEDAGRATPSAPRVPMMPPASLSDLPAGGPPPSDHFGWSSLPTTSVPAELASQGWELIPPGEAG